MELLLVIFAIGFFIYILAKMPSRSGSGREGSGKSSPIVFDRAEPGEPHQRVRVKYVVDGDTVIVSGFFRETTLRLYAIDCPEDGQPWGNIAKAGLIKMIARRHVDIETHGIDKYGRTLATIYCMRNGERVNVNERMVMLGHAWVTRQYYGQLERARQTQLDKLEQWARSKRVGLWQDNNPIPPWQWRNGR